MCCWWMRPETGRPSGSAQDETVDQAGPAQPDGEGSERPRGAQLPQGHAIRNAHVIEPRVGRAVNHQDAAAPSTEAGCQRHPGTCVSEIAIDEVFQIFLAAGAGAWVDAAFLDQFGHVVQATLAAQNGLVFRLPPP